jgi:hypothetical protein
MLEHRAERTHCVAREVIPQDVALVLTSTYDEAAKMYNRESSEFLRTLQGLARRLSQLCSLLVG